MVQKVDMPDPDQCRHDWQVVLERCVAKVFVHLVCPGQQFLKAVETDCERDGQSDGRPEGITATNPIPESEYTIRADAECSRGFEIGGNGREVMCDQFFFRGNRGQSGQQPGTCGACVGQGFLRRESL